ncbi:lipopolysaccharide biosynthesis protein [Candidatus Parcubacteria bacterium]|nr:lipopolysaccharide biosynthesis protein [Candidatus Parcubacteria bacterium]
MDFSKAKQAIKKIISPGQNLSNKTAKGTFWLFAFRIADQGLRLGKTIVLARLLAPSDFGLFGITVLAMSLLDTFSQSGFEHALIQKKEDIGPYLDTGWVVKAARGLLLASLLFLFSPLIASFFNAPQVRSILQWVALAIVIQGLTNIAVVYFSKELQFHKYFFYQISGTFADFTASVIAAVMLRSVWALVIGLLAGMTIRCIVSYIAYPYLPRFKFSFAKAKELFGYGKWIFSSSIIGFFLTQIDSLLVGKIAGVASLGFYQVSYKIPSILGSDILSGAIFPAYSKLQGDMEKMKNAYLKILQIFCFILLPMAGGIYAVAPEFINLFLGAKWMPSLWPMRILCLAVVVWSIEVVSNHLFLALGKPHIETKWNSVRFAVMVALLYPFILEWGITGAALAVLAGSLVGATGFSFQAIRTINCSTVEFLKRIIVPVVTTSGMVAVIFSLKWAIPTDFFGFFILIVIGVAAYGVLTYLADFFLENKTIHLLQKSLSLLLG